MSEDIAASQLFENPFYPLQGPPRNAEERVLLEGYISAEKASSAKAVHRRLRNGDLQAMANANCADAKWALATCLKQRSAIELLTTFCMHEQRRLSHCVAAQTRLLKQVGWHKLPPSATDRERMLLAMEADKMYLHELDQQETQNTSPTSSDKE
ncbi:hypothetical protein BC830DRAFT_1127427 [Chytriomyces sp. MP71]|nr:hypothetical protein BC830DRAFT_1127427 [Chytriomyces sp. MP71]